MKFRCCSRVSLDCCLVWPFGKRLHLFSYWIKNLPFVFNDICAQCQQCSIGYIGKSSLLVFPYFSQHMLGFSFVGIVFPLSGSSVLVIFSVSITLYDPAFLSLYLNVCYPSAFIVHSPAFFQESLTTLFTLVLWFLYRL